MKKQLFDELMKSAKEDGRLLYGEWSKETPQEIGYYWFYGDPFTSDINKDCQNELNMVEVWRISNGYAYVCKGNFMENERGLWQKMYVPELPKVPYSPDIIKNRIL